MCTIAKKIDLNPTQCLLAVVWLLNHGERSERSIFSKCIGHLKLYLDLEVMVSGCIAYNCQMFLIFIDEDMDTAKYIKLSNMAPNRKSQTNF